MDKREPGFWEMKATGKDSKGPTGSLEPSLRPPLPERDLLKVGIHKAAGLSPAEVVNLQSPPPSEAVLWFKVLVYDTVKISSSYAAGRVCMTEFL